MNRIFGFLVLLGLCLGAVFPAFANQRIALVIGNSDYEYAPLANPVRDAALMAETLREVGFEVLEYTDLDRRDLTKAFITLGEKLENAGTNATALVYYAGHGAQVNGENYLIPVGARIEEEIDVEIEGVRASSLLRTLKKAKSALNIVILDACRNNPFESSGRSATRGLAKMDAPTGTLLAYSTAPGKVAEDGSGNNSTYTRALARAIKTPGAKVEEVFKTVRVSVVDRTQGRQVPWESSSLTGDFIFQEKLPEPEPVVTASTDAVDTTQIEIEYWKSIATSTDPALFETYLSEYPDGIFKSIAEQRVASLNAALVEPQQDDGFAREKAVWESIKDSGNIGMLKGFLESFPDGTFATIARSTIANLETQQQTASRTTQPIDEELVIWDSVRNANTMAEVQIYLDAYPEGKFAKLAHARIAALDTGAPEPTTPAPAPAAFIPANPDYPFDGTWRLTGKPASLKGPHRFGICRYTDTVDSIFEIKRGEVDADLTSSQENKLYIEGKVNNAGAFGFDFKTSGGPGSGFGKLRDTHDPGVMEVPFSLKIASAGNSGCEYDFTMTRQASVETADPQQVAALTPAPNAAANPKYPFDGTWRVVGEPYAFMRAYRFGVCQNGDRIDDTITIENGRVRDKVSSESDHILKITGSVTANGRVELDFVTGEGGASPIYGKYRRSLDGQTSSIPFKLKLESGHGMGCRYNLTMTRQ